MRRVLAQLFPADVNIPTLAQHIKRYRRKYNKPNRNFPHTRPIMKKALTREGLLKAHWR